ncbi:MAG: ABC transporter ATP-binding protein [Acidobacteriota bacterium]
MSENPDVSLDVRDLTKSYTGRAGTVDVLRDVSFHLAAGDSLAITGPSGSGKSTLLQIVGTLDRPTSGSVTVGSEHPFELADDDLAAFRNRRVGFIFQDHHLLPQYSVLENVLLPTLAFAGKARGDRDRALELLDRVGLSHRLGHRPAELSGGERQRVAVARSLINRPALLLCDEPTGSLDAKTAHTVSDLLLEMHAAEPAILIVVTHSLELADRFARRFELKEGSCVEI